MLRKKIALAAFLAALAARGNALAGGQNQNKAPLPTLPVADESVLPNQHPWNQLAWGGRWWGAVPLYCVPLRESVPVAREPQIQLVGITLNDVD